MNIIQSNQKVNSQSSEVLAAIPLGNVRNGVSEGFFNDQMLDAGGFSSFPAGGQAEASDDVTRLLSGTSSEADRVFRLNFSDRLRVPGDDDEGPFPVRSSAIFDEDPFEGVGSQRGLDLEGSPYLDIYALNRGVGESEEKSQSQEKSISEQYHLELNRSHACGCSASFSSTDDFEDYMSPIDCRKAWCPKCGGKGGKVHKARKKAIRDRIDIDRFNLRYLVLTVPERFRHLFMSRKGLNGLTRAARRLTGKVFGEKTGAAYSWHLYGDKDPWKFNPHLNVIVPEEKSVKLKLSRADLDDIKTTWKRSLIGLGCVGIDVVDVFYEFRIKAAHKGHLIKYVAKPTWDAETLDHVDEAEQWFLVLGLKGFRYVNFWGTLSNRLYRESMAQTIREAKQTAEEVIGKKLYFRGVFPVNVELMLSSGHIVPVCDGLYRIVKHTEKNRFRWVENEDSSGFRKVADG